MSLLRRFLAATSVGESAPVDRTSWPKPMAVLGPAGNKVLQSLAVNKHLHAMRFPHCDQRVLHAPGECDYCDQHAEWQALRQAWGIAFTGHEPTPDGQVCPADFARGDAHQDWPGNRAKKEKKP